MSSQWEVYFTNLGNNVASVRFDMAYTNPEFRPDFLQTLLYVWVQLQTPNADGLSTDAESPRLFSIEDRLDEFLGAEYGAVPVGMVTTEGRREFYFYAESGENLHEELAPILAEFPDYAFQVGDKSDPEWQHYFGYLFPSPTELQWMQDLKTVTQLEEHGDPLTPRPVQHWFYFRTAESRDQVKALLIVEGFEVDHEPDLENAFGLVLLRTDAVDLDSIHKVTAPLTALAMQYEGQYDGWETMVIQK
jgi:hypothetical protein